MRPLGLNRGGGKKKKSVYTLSVLALSSLKNISSHCDFRIQRHACGGAVAVSMRQPKATNRSYFSHLLADFSTRVHTGLRIPGYGLVAQLSATSRRTSSSVMMQRSSWGPDVKEQPAKSEELFIRTLQDLLSQA